MLERTIYEGDRETAWCPGCGNFAIRSALISALVRLGIEPDEVTMFTGIGQAAKMPHYLKINGFNGLHGRALPPAIGMRIANPEMKVIVESGDGDTYGEGGNHLLHNIRRNPDITHLVHNNQIYGLTKGQASPTTGAKMRTTVQPGGPTASPLNPVHLAVALGASFVARGFAGDPGQLEDLICAALEHRGYALVDILQPCVSFNKVNTYQWYKERVYTLDEGYDPTDDEAARKKVREWGEKIPTGVLFRCEKPVFRDQFIHLGEAPLVGREVEPTSLEFLLDDV